MTAGLTHDRGVCPCVCGAVQTGSGGSEIRGVESRTGPRGRRTATSRQPFRRLITHLLQRVWL